MPSECIVLMISYLFAFYMAWNIGAHDVVNSIVLAKY
jgi:phosphate/sulfate permease